MCWLSNESQQIYLKEKSPAIIQRVPKKSNGKKRFNNLYIKGIKNKSNASVSTIFLHVYLLSESVTWSDALAKYSCSPSLEGAGGRSCHLFRTLCHVLLTTSFPFCCLCQFKWYLNGIIMYIFCQIYRLLVYVKLMAWYLMLQITIII